MRCLLRDILYFLAAVLTSPLWGWRLWRTGKWRTDWAGKFGKTPPLPPGSGPTILFHAVSVGEVNAIRALVSRLHEHLAANAGPGTGAATDASSGGSGGSAGSGGGRIVICTTTDTGFRRATELYAARHTVVRYPLDFTFAVKRFLDALRPDLVALVELEVWPNFVAQCRRRDIPVCVVNGRLSARSFGRYKLIRPVLKRTFASLAAAGVQAQDYAQRFIALGTPAENVHVLDTMKWDTAQALAEGVDPVAALPGAAELAKALGIDRARPLIVAGSTAPGEDKLLIDTCPPHAQLLLVPRKPEWFKEVAALAPAPGMVQRSKHPDGTVRPPDGQRLFLLDTMGELRKAYALADVCIVGRSFLGLFGSDMMEPIALGKPTIIGPYHSDFADIMAALVAQQGIVVTDQPGPAAARLLAHRSQAQALADRGRRVILSRQGATRRHLEMLLGVLEHRRS